MKKCLSRRLGAGALLGRLVARGFAAGQGDVGLVNNQAEVRNRLCYLEANRGAPLQVSEPFPCPAVKPGCANHP
jgi:hypothetical protein